MTTRRSRDFYSALDGSTQQKRRFPALPRALTSIPASSATMRFTVSRTNGKPFQHVSEHAMQVAVIDWWRLAFNKYEHSLWAIPNGDYRTWRSGRRLKLEGAKPGAPDLILTQSRGAYHACFVELKQPDNKPSDAQVAFMHMLRDAGYGVWWCTSFDDTTTLLTRYMALKGTECLSV